MRRTESRDKTILGIGIAILIIVITVSGYVIWREGIFRSRVEPASKEAIDTKKLIAEVGKLLVLPKDEEPAMATVTDLAALKDKPFFAAARVGDKVLIYAKAGKAILYRPSERKIIAIGPVELKSR